MDDFDKEVDFEAALILHCSVTVGDRKSLSIRQKKN